MTRRAIPLALVLTACLVACTSGPSMEAKPEAKLIGKWEEVATPKEHTLVQFEFFPEDTVIENHKVLGRWAQYAAGSFKFVDSTHVKIELQPSWAIGVVVYEVNWQDQDHVVLKAADKAIQLNRVKPGAATTDVKDTRSTGSILMPVAVTASRDDAAFVIQHCGRPDREFTEKTSGTTIRHLVYHRFNTELFFFRGSDRPQWSLGNAFVPDQDEDMTMEEANRRMHCARGQLHSFLQSK